MHIPMMCSCCAFGMNPITLGHITLQYLADIPSSVHNTIIQYAFFRIKHDLALHVRIL
jgi:hypothetical protein